MYTSAISSSRPIVAQAINSAAVRSTILHKSLAEKVVTARVANLRQQTRAFSSNKSPIVVLLVAPASNRLKEIMTSPETNLSNNGKATGEGPLSKVDFSKFHIRHAEHIFRNQGQMNSDPTLDELKDLVLEHKPYAVVAGNNNVPRPVLEALAKVGGKVALRRGVDPRSIDQEAAKQLNITVETLPGVNSPFVAAHMMKFFKFPQDKIGQKAAVIGTGKIGQPLVDFFLENKQKVSVYSPSLINEETRAAEMKNKGLDPQIIGVDKDFEEAFNGASHVAISIPWQDSDGKEMKGVFTEKMVNSLADGATVVTCSVPWMFTDEALAAMNKLAGEGKLTFRVDTAQRHAELVNQKYPNLGAGFNQAFAAQECQEALDAGWMKKVGDHYEENSAQGHSSDPVVVH